MQVEVITATHRPMDVIAVAAGCCYGKKDKSWKRVRTCFKAGHMSVFEHPCATLYLSGLSRVCSHQLVRHRIGVAFNQQSQRYCEVDVDGDDWYVTPPEFDGGHQDSEGFDIDRKWFGDRMYECGRAYTRALEAGIKPEDARYLLGEAACTELVMTMNARELFHFFDLRQSQAAQWEIRDLAHAIEDALMEHDEQWRELMMLRRNER